MPYTHERLGGLLVAQGVLSSEQLGVALELQSSTGRKLGRILVENDMVSEDQIAGTLAEQKGLERVRLNSATVDPAVAASLPLRVARRHVALPISVDGDVLTLAMADPLNIEAADDVSLRTGYEVRVVVATETEVLHAIDKYIAEVDALHELSISRSINEIRDDDALAESAADAGVAVVRMINQIIRQAVVERASDIHFQPSRRGVRVRFRIDGVLREVSRLPRGAQSELLSRVKVMADLDITERRRPQDGRISIQIDGRDLDVRVATLPTPYGESITLRLLDSEVAYRPLDEIGLAPREHDALLGMLKVPYGVIFVSGPTGSGKSTTLYAALNALDDPGKEIITVEDPIEFTMEGITQIAVNTRVGLTFASGLRTILRSDPDVVMVGEVRDPETAETAIRAALTGHLVLSSIHTNDAPSTLTRLNDMGVAAYITSSALLGVIAQRLVRVLCPDCKAAVDISPEKLMAAGFDEEELADLTVLGPVGCEACNTTGYRGRLGVFEVMPMSECLQSLYLKDAPAEELRKVAISEGMRPLRRDALDKVAAGITSLDEVDRVVI